MSLSLGSGLTVEVAPPVVPTVTAALPATTIVVVPVAGPPGAPGASANAGYSHTQLTADEVWHVPHGLGFYPAGIVVRDSVGDICEPADIVYVDLDHTDLLFTGRAMSGTVKLS